MHASISGSQPAVFCRCGYVQIEDALTGEALRQTQAEFTAGAEGMRPKWEAAKAGEELRVDGHIMENVPTEVRDPYPAAILHSLPGHARSSTCLD